MELKDKIAGVYVIWSPTKKFYVGQSWNIKQRIKGYVKLRAKSQPYLYNSLLKYGAEKHKFEVLESYSGTNQHELDLIEKNHWLKLLSDGYESLNCREPNGSRGKLSEETKRRLSLSHKGKRLGKFHTEITKQKISLLNLS